MDYVQVPRLIHDSQRCEACAKANRTCTVTEGHAACNWCHSRKTKCTMPSAGTTGERSPSVESSAAPSLPSSLARGVKALGVSSRVEKTPSRADKRKVEVGSSPEDQPPRRRSKPNLKEASGMGPPPQVKPSSDKVKVDLEKRIGALEKRISTFNEFCTKSVEDFQEQLDALRNEAEEGSSKARGKGKSKA